MAASSDPIRLEGVYVAVVTPFDDDGVVLWSEFEAVIRRQIDAGVDGIVLLGSTGEWPTLTPEELRESVTRGVALCAGKVQCVVGTGTNCTRTTVEMTRFAKDAGADCCMVVNPYYNKPQQRGMIAHIRAVADVGLPIMLYNNVGRSAVKLEVETVLELAKLPEVVAIKDATGGIQDALRLLEAGGIRVFTAHDTFVVPLMAVGASGIISVACNVCPDLIVRMVAAARAGDFAAATACHNKLVALQAALVLDTNPSGSKYALYKMGVISSPATRAPVAEFAPEYRPALDAALAKAGLLPE